MSNEERLRSLLSDLGKATLRGVKKCPKCGTYNGSRGLCCKNKYCDAVFKEPGEKRKLSTEACKLITGSTVQVFSVRVRDKGPDYRGFVQLPLMNTSTSISMSISNDMTLMSQSTALCFVDSCERSFDTSVLKCHENDSASSNQAPSASTCQHIQAALRCYAEAQPLTLKNSILSSLNVNNEMKQEIWLLATETSGPLVQRVSKTIMAVKCKASPKHPLGYLHFSFYTGKFKERVEHRYFCTCTAFKAGAKVSELRDEQFELLNRRCAHFYACICAFASDPKLSEEFRYYINLDQVELRMEDSFTAPFQPCESDKIIGMDLESLTDDTHLLIFRDDTLTVQSLDGTRLDIDSINLELSNGIVEEINSADCPTFLDSTDTISQETDCVIDQSNQLIDANSVEILEDQPIEFSRSDSNDYLVDNQTMKLWNTGGIKILDTQGILGKNVKLLDTSTLMNGVKIGNPSGDAVTCEAGLRPKIPAIQPHSAKRKREDGSSPCINNLNSIETRKGMRKAAIIKKYHNSNSDNVDEANAGLSFTKWLSSITERINQTMHYQFDGNPEPLVFHAPQIFFDCLRERISCGGKKKRLPNFTTAFVRKDGVPLGTFTKYTWQITNILHVKSIFDTAMIPLEITRSFLQNSDGTYELFKGIHAEVDRYQRTSNSAVIKPVELKTYLKVGNTCPNQVEPTPFLIEWIPDILPVSKIGELRLRFEFGHMKNEAPHKKKIALMKNYSSRAD